MPWKAVSPLKIYSLLPKTNCKECGAENCMAFAVGLANMETKLEKCPPILQEKYKKLYTELKNMLSPPIREVEFGNGQRRVKIGGEYVMYRHELTYLNPTAIAIDVDDDMGESEIIKRIKFVDGFSYMYIGRELKLDALAVRSVSNEPQKFKKVVKFVSENTNLPLILCSLDPKVMEAGLSALEGGRPLMYAATKDNWREMAEMSLAHKCPLVVFSPNDLSTLSSLVKGLTEYGVNDLVLDPGTFANEGLSLTTDAFTMLRWKACNDGDKLLGFPIFGAPLTAWLGNGDGQTKAWWEAITAAALIDRYAGVLLMHTIEGWALLPNVILRFNIYTDPRKPVSVKPGLRMVGNPNENSPIIVTSNFALTYYIVSNDIEAGKVDCYLLVADSGGISLESAVAGRKFTAKEVAAAVKESGIEKMVKHKTIIIPGKAARLLGEIEDSTGWKVMVGPQDSSDIPKFVKERWTRLKE